MTPADGPEAITGTRLYRDRTFENAWIGRSERNPKDARLYIDSDGIKLGINYRMTRSQWVALRSLIDSLLAEWPDEPAAAVAARAHYHEPIEYVPRQHDEAACDECKRAIDRKWPPSGTCDAGYRDRCRVSDAWDRESGARRRALEYAATALIDPASAALAAASARAEKAEAEARVSRELLDDAMKTIGGCEGSGSWVTGTLDLDGNPVEKQCECLACSPETVLARADAKTVIDLVRDVEARAAALDKRVRGLESACAEIVAIAETQAHRGELTEAEVRIHKIALNAASALRKEP